MELPPQTTGRIRVMVVDDDGIVRSALSSYVRTAPDLDLVHSSENGAEALDALATVDVDVVVMDIRMPVMDGIAATERMRAAYPALAILLLTSFDQDDSMVNGLRAGASGFLLKNSAPEAVVDAIRTVHQGSTVVSPEPIRRLVDLQSTAPRATPPKHLNLSARELEILSLLCDAHSNAEIANELHLSESTVKTHVSAIMGKMMVTSRLKAVVKAHEWGLVSRT